MTLRCPSCGVSLRLKDDRLGERKSARCPQCKASVPLAGAPASLRIECASCGVKLKAPAASAGTRSRCPKCKAEVLIGAATTTPKLPGRTRHEDSSGAVTRRIDSRTLGLAGASATQSTPGGMDLDAFIKASAPPPAAEPHEKSFGVAAALMKPPVAEMEKIAGEIRLAARSFDPAAIPAPAPLEKASIRSPLIDRNGPEPARSEPFPASRGLVLGGVAGLLVGGVSMAVIALAGVRFAGFIAPLPLGENLAGIPTSFLRVLLPALLGSLAGFIAAAAGSPTRADRPLSLWRAGGFALLAGLACGLVTTLSVSDGMKIWPIASWMRDLLVAGFLTTALDKIVHVPRS